MEEILRSFKALADATRLRIMLLLLKEELCVCEMETVFSMEQSRISHALRSLRQAGLIEERRDGRWIFYKASEALPKTLYSYLSEFATASPESLNDSKNVVELLKSSKPKGKRCPLRNK